MCEGVQSSALPISKATGIPFAKVAARLMAGEKLRNFDLNAKATGRHMAVKEAVFPFARFPGVDVMLGPEMRSTGEVMGLDSDFGRAFAKSQLAGGVVLPTEGTVFISVKDGDKQALIAPARQLAELGFRLLATAGTAEFLRGQGIDVTDRKSTRLHSS